ncbi:sigma factor [Vagococcus jeotgali]|uniref:sigma factor n=1 Tax=Vagococcus jeotgali TaxID=3109030 RepID=UPI002DD93CEC|nr:sigma factor [Vagococcus sp. B2T-5]
MDKALESLINKAKNGCQDSLCDIFEMYKPIVLKIRHRTYLKDYDLDDWLQEGRISCLQSVETFDATRGVTFGNYFKGNFTRHTYSLIRKQEAKKRKSPDVVISFDDYIKSEEMTRLDITTVGNVEYIFIRESIETFSADLSEFERQSFLKILSSDSDMILSEQELRALSRAKRKLKKHLL